MEPERAVEPREVPVAAPACADPPTDPLELDYLYKEADRIYYLFARRCGLSTCAYWMMYDIERAGGSIALIELSDSWSYSKQTINSAIKSLEARGLISLAFAEGSRRNKVASLTDEGKRFTERYIVPAQQAERRAFNSLDPAERTALIASARSYTQALRRELERAEQMDTEEKGSGESA